MLKPAQLRLIREIAETGQLQQAAEACAMTQPAASRMLAETERQVGAPLFLRLRNAADHDVVHERGVEPGLGDERVQGLREQLLGVHARERAFVLLASTSGGSCGVDDVGSHDCRSFLSGAFPPRSVSTG